MNDTITAIAPSAADTTPIHTKLPASNRVPLQVRLTPSDADSERELRSRAISSASEARLKR